MLKRICLPILALCLSLSLVGCSSGGTTSPVANLVEQYAVYKGVNRYVGGDPAKAARVQSVTGEMLELLTGEAPVLVPLLEAALRERIEWQNLDPVDQMLLDQLIVAVRVELQHRISAGELPADATVALRKVMTWANSAASLTAASAT